MTIMQAIRQAFTTKKQRIRILEAANLQLQAELDAAEDALTACYMLGKHDGKKEAKQ
jgi:hypothetical protein